MSQDNLVGRTVAGYKLLSHVGEGGTATVYRAEHSERGPAAIKILRPRMAQDPVAVKRFLREAEFGARINHEYIIRTYDYGEAEGLYFLALEWAQGEPLGTFLSAAGRLAPPLAAKIIEQLGAALAVAHKAGIIHRDLKPANIMYDPETQTARLLDFGIARDAEDNPADRLDPGGVLRGHAAVRGPRGVVRRAGGRAGRCLQPGDHRLPSAHRHPPLPRAQPARAVPAAAHPKSPIPLNEAVKGLKFSKEVEAAVMTGLERDLTKRWKTVGEFAKAFCTAAGAEATPEKKGGFLSSFFRRGSE